MIVMDGENGKLFRCGEVCYLRLAVVGIDHGGGPLDLPKAMICEAVDRKGNPIRNEGVTMRHYIPEALLVKSKIVAEDEK